MDDEARAELLLAGPCGRRLCLNVAIGVRDSLWPSHLHAAWELGNEKLLAVFLADLDGVDVAAVAGTSDESAFLDALEEAVADAAYWQEPSEYDILLSDPRVVSALRPVASAVAAALQPAGGQPRLRRTTSTSSAGREIERSWRNRRGCRGRPTGSPSGKPRRSRTSGPPTLGRRTQPHPTAGAGGQRPTGRAWSPPRGRSGRCPRYS